MAHEFVDKCSGFCKECGNAPVHPVHSAHAHDYSVVDYDRRSGCEIWECFSPNCPKPTIRVHTKE